ncbi:dynein axonemal heavy chain 17-like [Amphiprion ocellaris]|uniref:dynein axonemal heavy chain 17-like n=1 Tax=Amphiprion ocellaris TaxID=80972 RepID=UPI00241147E8|nr:dynein axonemal heavy chain 17-like [Amphiprion ocellaris]XP_054870779.1 dynein axonemal heavy chain 17-like [Amphiprion ocellaris]
MCYLQQVKEEAELLRAGLDRYSHLWQSDSKSVLEEFLTYGRQLGPEELEADETPPTLQDFQREIESLDRVSAEVTHLDEVMVVRGWLQVDLRPIRDSLLSIIHHRKHLYTDYLLESVRDSQQQATRPGDNEDEDDEESYSSSGFPLTEIVLLLEAAAVQLPEHLAAQVLTSL